MLTRGALYITWGNEASTLAQRSIESLHRHHPDLPVKEIRLEDKATLLDKARMFDLSPFDQTLFLDCDTVVLGDLTAGFEAAEQHSLACCINECPWARRYPSLGGDDIEYNTGVLFFTKAAKPVFDAWRDCAATIDSSIQFYRDKELLRMPANDQAGFAKAIKDTGSNPFVLPLNWNFRPQWHKSWFGNIKIWHDYNDVPQPVLDYNAKHPNDERIIGFAQAVASNRPNLPPTVAVMSMGRYALARNLFCSHKALFPLGIEMDVGFGVYYHKIMCGKWEQWVQPERGMKYILCIDYDSLYEAGDVYQLIALAEQHPEADAICACQIKRGENAILGTIERDGQVVNGRIKCEGDLTPIATGHFGLTLLRVESLRKLPRPWMQFQTDPKGGWGEGCVDSDVWFWKQMRDAGQKAFMAHNVRIGHIEEVDTRPGGEEGGPGAVRTAIGDAA